MLEVTSDVCVLPHPNMHTQRRCAQSPVCHTYKKPLPRSESYNGGVCDIAEGLEQGLGTWRDLELKEKLLERPRENKRLSFELYFPKQVNHSK